MFGYAKEHEPCIIFMDEIDAIGGRRFSEGTSADREIQRTLMELLNQLDGFDYLGKTKIIMATNRPDTLDPALLRAGRLDRKIEIPLPNEVGRLEILKIHSQSVVVDGDLDFESVVKMSDGLNGADLRNVVTEAYARPLHIPMMKLTAVTEDCSPSKITEMQSTKMISTRQSVRSPKRRSWRASLSIRSCNLDIGQRIEASGGKHCSKATGNLKGCTIESGPDALDSSALEGNAEMGMQGVPHLEPYRSHCSIWNGLSSRVVSSLLLDLKLDSCVGTSLAVASRWSPHPDRML